MAFSLLLFLIISSSLATVSLQDEALIDKVCEQAEPYDLCIDALLSDPRSITADLHGLATISLHLMFMKILDNDRVITELLYTAQDPDMREALETCQGLYGVEAAMHEIQEALRALSSKNYVNLIDAADDIGNDALDCDYVIRLLDIYPSPLGLRNEYLFHLSEITIAIAHLIAL